MTEPIGPLVGSLVAIALIPRCTSPEWSNAVCVLIPAPSGPSSTINSPRFTELSPSAITDLLALYRDYSQTAEKRQDDGRWTMDDGRWTMDDGRWTMDDQFLTARSQRSQRFAKVFMVFVFSCRR